MEVKTPIKPACVNSIRAKKLLGLLYDVRQVETKITGYEIAVNRQRIFAMPSSFREKVEFRPPNHGVENCRASSAFIKRVPRTAITSVTRETTSARMRTPFSSLIKKESKPPINGTKKRDKTIISKSKFKSRLAKGSSLLRLFTF
ncbi:hypothetical protein [Flavisolibacter nicotianae]|nr:hypothetical protein [Flavisolibacter nicotianae]